MRVSPFIDLSCPLWLCLKCLTAFSDRGVLSRERWDKQKRVVQVIVMLRTGKAKPGYLSLERGRVKQE